MTLESLWLRAIAFIMLVGIIGFMTFLLFASCEAVYHIFVTTYSLLGGHGG